MKHMVITIGCEYGAGGPEIGKMLAKALGIEYYDRDLVDKIINDLDGVTLAAASTLTLSKTEAGMHCNKSGAEMVGKEIARMAKEKNINQVVFDRNGYIYHGRVKAVADGAREGGLEF